ncbi:MAG: type IV pilus assembly protein PilM [Candidatus Andersenbacteria bacterium]|nr:type IV pilus assembly protein PilM [bacterium]MDZ4225469.1 type IV pilus assembly protein PilM [Candidatus Andersenbacteria bacterium]
MIGIDISERSIKMVRLGNDRQHRLETYSWVDLPEGVIERGVVKTPEAVQKAIVELFRRGKLSLRVKDAVVASIPEAESFLQVVQIPTMDESEIGEAVQWEVAQHIPFGLENVYLDWQWVRRSDKKTSGKHEVLVGAAEKKVVDPLWSVLSSLGLDVAALELESQAFIRALISPELSRRAGLLVVDLGSDTTNVVIHDRGTIRFSASLSRGVEGVLANLSEIEQEQIKKISTQSESAVPEKMYQRIKADLEALVAEAHGIVEYYTRPRKDRWINEVLLTGGGSNLPGLDAVFLRYFDNVHIQRGNPWVNIMPTGDPTQPMGLAESVHYSTALGLALRPVIL